MSINSFYDPFQVEINISNINAKGDIVLNDQKLLELILLYPFLYNPRVRPYQDEYYDNWAWENITNAFNISYSNQSIPATFTSLQLQQRWEALKPIISSLVKAPYEAIPDGLRRTIVKINVQLENNSSNFDANTKLPSKVESLILSQIPFVESLPIEERKKLEFEMMELLLTTEIETRATVKANAKDLQRIDKEVDEFLNVIGLEKLEINSSEEMTMPELETDNDANSNASLGLGAKNDKLCAVFTPDFTEIITPDDNTCTEQKEKLQQKQNIEDSFESNYCDIKPTFEETQVRSPTNSSSSQPIDNRIRLNSSNSVEQHNKNVLSVFSGQRLLVPLKSAHYYIRKVRVRVKRIHMEDYLPLSHIKRRR